MEVHLTLLAEHYEQPSLLISSYRVFSQWDQIFKGPMTTIATIGRLAHHAIILEFDGTSLRAKKRPIKRNNPPPLSPKARQPRPPTDAPPPPSTQHPAPSQ